MVNHKISSVHKIGFSSGRKKVPKTVYLESPETLKSQFPEQSERIAHVHQPCLHITFQPSRTLVDPYRQPVGGFFPGTRGNNRGFIALLEKTNAEVGILGNIERVPGSDFFQFLGLEMIGGAPRGSGIFNCITPGSKARTTCCTPA